MQEIAPGIFIGGEIAPPAQRPLIVNAYQARMALLHAGLLDDVEEVIANLPEPGGQAARLAWEFKTEISRDGPLLNAVAQQLGLSAADVDDLFAAAQAIPPV